MFACSNGLLKISGTLLLGLWHRHRMYLAYAHAGPKFLTKSKIFGFSQTILGDIYYITVRFIFSGVTLSQAGASVTWDPENKDEFPNNFKLIIKQILLGHEAKENEFNVVEVRSRISVFSFS